jgi:hypothetical protein
VAALALIVIHNRFILIPDQYVIGTGAAASASVSSCVSSCVSSGVNSNDSVDHPSIQLNFRCAFS